ncbi:MAG TPA: PKD domain-containing protein [Vicinamibacterales bacterium]|jgi:hypothetical protein
MVRAFRTFALLTTVAALATACSVKSTTEPALSGPSELSLSLTLQANPDVITQDGASQSQIVVLARDASAQPLRNVSVRVEITQGGKIADYGTLSTRTVVTGSDGRAVLTYTAPAAPAQSVDTGANIITLMVTPINGNYANAMPRTVDIRLVPPGVIIPPSDLVPGFTFSPTAPKERDSVIFTAPFCTATGQTGCTTGSVVSFEWRFGDGATGFGQTVTHAFDIGSWPVTLTIKDANQRAASVMQVVTIGAGEVPKPAFEFSPAGPVVNQNVFFNGSASTAANTRTIVDYEWNFGDGTVKHGVTQVHSFDAKGTYTVTLKVTDDAGRYGVVSRTVSVVVPAP